MSTIELATEETLTLNESERSEILVKLRWIRERIRQKPEWYPDHPKVFEKSLIPLSAFCPITDEEEQTMCKELSTKIDHVIELTENINSSIDLIRVAFRTLLEIIPISAPPCGAHIRELLEWMPSFSTLKNAYTPPQLP